MPAKTTLRSGVRRRLRNHKKHAANVSKKTERNIDRYFFGRFEKIGKVGRFMAGWLVLFTLLIACVVAQNSALSGYYQTSQPVPGGIFREGIVGSFTNANPIYATNDVDVAVSRLVFAGLLTHDQHNKLAGDLASSWKVDTTGKIYTITLRPDLRWQDGQPLTADDVVFTYHVIQDKDAESPLRSSWLGIAVQKVDERTVTFTLPNPLSSFADNLTNGIVPQHLLQAIPVTGLRSAPFNTQVPIGAGPFRWADIRVSGSSPAEIQERIGLVPFENYWAGAPKLRSFTLHAFARSQDMINAYADNQLTAMAGLTSRPEALRANSSIVEHSFTLTAANMVFFRTTSDVFKDKTVRKALVAAAKPDEIIEQLNYVAPAVREPVLASQFAYNSKYEQHTNDLSQATSLLDKAGWKVGSNGYRMKKNKPLQFNIVAPNTAEARMITAQLQRQWKALGVRVEPQLLDDISFHSALVNHDYDALLYGITIGADPDVFVYWDSTQNDVRSANRLNFSEYESDKADAALEAGRTRAGEALRKVKYEPFLKSWQEDAPALGLYQPRFLYMTRGQIYGLEQHTINKATDRYNDVQNWMIRTAQVTNDK